MLRLVARDWKDPNTAVAQKQYFKEHLLDYYGEKSKGADILSGNIGDVPDMESIGRWVGKAAATLELGEKVTAEQYDALASNRHPTTVEKLKPRDIKQPKLNEELVIAPPKSVSLAWGLLGDEEVKKAHAEAVTTMLRHMEKDVAARKRAGLEKNTFANEDTGNMVASVFEHDTARAVDNGREDMFLHSHILLWNYTQDKQGKWKAAELGKVMLSLPFYKAVYYSALAEKLQRLGYGIARKGEQWELAGFSRELVDKFSKRTEQVKKEEQRLRELFGRLLSDKEKDKLGERTRGKKSRTDIKTLRKEWQQQLSKKERLALNILKDKVSKGRGIVPLYMEKSAIDAVDHAKKASFERKSVVKAPRFMATAIMKGIGSSSFEQVCHAVKKDGQLHWGSDKQGVKEVSTFDILKEEAKVLQAFRKGQDTLEPLVRHYGHYAFQHPYLKKETMENKGQREAVRHVIASKDRFTFVQGRAGVGKTTSSQELASLLKDRLVAFAPTTGAVEVLKKDGFKEVHTTQMLERSARLQKSIKGKVWLVDEAGLLSGSSMLRLTELAEKQDARVILMGDSTQHESVERGNPFRMVGEWMKDSIKIASIDHIWRQQGDYKKVVESITKGDTNSSLENLQKLGWVHEKKIEIYKGVAEKYVEILKKRETVVATAPIHKEKHQVSKTIRTKLKEAKLLGKRESRIDILKPKNWTRAEREDFTKYEKGQVVKFVQNAKGGFIKSEKFEVVSKDDTSLQVRSLAKPKSVTKTLSLEYADRFQVFEKEQLMVSKGEKLLINSNSKKDGLYNGQVLEVKKVDKKGIYFKNGTMVPKNFGHFTYAYTRTSHSIQGSTINHVLPVISGDSHRAAGLKQWYVDVSRGNKSCQVFTDDLSQLEQSIGKTQEEKAALEMRPILKQRSSKPPMKMIL